MPESWESVANKPEFQSLPPDQKVAASKQYFDTVVKPQVPAEHLTAAQQQFATHVKETIPRSFGESMSERAGAAMDEKPSGFASLIRKKVLGFDPITPLSKAAGVIASPVGAAGETLERKAGQAVGANPVKLEKAARDTGDVTGDLTGILPGAKAAKAAGAVAEGTAAMGNAVKEDVGLLKSGWSARDDATLDAARDSIESQANTSAAALRKMGVTINPETGQALIKHIDNEIKESDFGELHPKLHGGTMEILDEMRAEAPKGMTIQKFDIYRKLLRQEANAGGENGKLARQVMDTMRDSAQTLVNKSKPGEGGEAFNHLYNYVDNWAKAQRFDTLSSIVKDAKGDPNKIQMGFKTLLKNERKMRGFNDEEKAAIKRASENATSQSLLTLASKFGVNINKGVSGNTLPFAGALTAKVMGAPRTLEAGAIAGGTAAGYGRKLMARGAAENALSAVEKRPTGFNADQALGAETDPLAIGVRK